MKRKLVIFMLALFATAGLFAQNKVRGKVTDGVVPLGGASVLEQGTSNGVITDLDGNYEIIVKPGAVLVFSSEGFTPSEIVIHNQAVLNVKLEEAVVFVVPEELIEVGYGTMKKSDYTGASVSLDESDLRGSILTSLDQAFQGRVAGVTSVLNSGAPGSSSAVRVRGLSTVNAEAEPLYVIDGVIFQGGDIVSTVSPLTAINPADIESMEFLKDAAATAIYGAQGANGVVLITTRHGSAGETKFSYDGMFGFSRQNRRIDMLNLREFAEFYNYMATLGEALPNPYYADPSLLGKGTSWQDEVFRTAAQHQHQISARGGSDKIHYYFSGSYANQEGTVIGTNFDRLSFRSNIDTQLKDWLKLGLNAAYAVTEDELRLVEGRDGIIFNALASLPDIPAFDLDGNYSAVERDGYTVKNPIALAMYNKDKLKRRKLAGNVYAEVTPIEHLVFRSEAGFDVSGSQADTYKPRLSLGYFQQDTNQIGQWRNSSTFLSVKNYVTYSNTFGRHGFSAMLGQEAWQSRWNYLGVSNSDLPSDEVRSIQLATGIPVTESGFGSSAMASFFTRETYNFDDRYLVAYTFRFDGSSNFGPDRRWAGYHSIAASWRFTNEKFYQRDWKKVLSDGKIRLSWGQTGNARIGAGAWESDMVSMPSALGESQRPASIPNTGLHGEKQEQLNFGIDLNFFQSRLNLIIDIYKKTTRDLFLPLVLPSYMGTQGNAASALSATMGNYGTVQNQGVEFTIDARPVDGQNFSWDSSLQLSFNSNKLRSLDGGLNSRLTGYGQVDDIVSVTGKGDPLFSFYGYKVAGIYKDYGDILNSPKAETFPENGVFNPNTTVWPGDIKFADLNGDGYINELDQTNLGSPFPIFTFGWNNSFRWRDFDLGIFFYGSVGNKVLNYNLVGYEGCGLAHMNSVWYNQHSCTSDRARLEVIDQYKQYPAGDSWQRDVYNVYVVNHQSRTPRPTIADPNDNDRMSDRYVEDGSYLRIKNITLGYTLPRNVLDMIRMENVRVYANIQNLWTMTRYSGYDPEVGISTLNPGSRTFGVDNGRYPSPLTCSFGLNITF